MSIKSRILIGSLVTLLLIAMAFTAAIYYRMALISYACKELASLDCHADRLYLGIDSQHLVLEVDELTVNNDESHSLARSQALAIKIGWRDLLKKRISIDQLTWQGLSVDVSNTRQWYQRAFEAADSPASNTSETSAWSISTGDLEINDWQFYFSDYPSPITLLIDQLSSHSTISNELPIQLSGSLQGRPISIVAKLTQAAEAKHQSLPLKIDIDANIAGIKLLSTGELDRQSGHRASWLEFNVDATAIDEISALFDFSLPVFNTFSASGKLQQDSKGRNNLDQLLARIDTSNGLKLNINGGIKDIFAAIEPELLVDLNISSLKKLLSFFNIPLATDIKIAANAGLSSDENSINVENLNAGVSLNGLNSHYGDQYTLTNSNLTLDLTLQQLIAQEDFSLPLTINDGLLSANIDLDQDAFGFDIAINQLPLTITSSDLKLSLDGRYKDNSVDLKLAFNDNWETLQAALETQAFTISSQVLLGAQDTLVNARFKLLSDQKLSHLLALPIPAIDGLDASAKLRLGKEVRIEQAELLLLRKNTSFKAQSQWLEKEQLHDVAIDLYSKKFSTLAEFLRQLKIDIDNTTDINLLLARIATRTTLDTSASTAPQKIDTDAWSKVIENNPWSLAAFTLETGFTFNSQNLNIQNFLMDMRGPLVESRIEGTVNIDKTTKVVDLQIDTDFKPGAFQKLKEQFTFQGTVFSKGQTVNSNDLLISYGSGTAKVNFRLDNENPEIPDLSASLVVENLDLSPFVRQMRENEQLIKQQKTTELQDTENLESIVTDDGKVIPDLALPVDWIDDLALNVNYRVNDLDIEVIQIDQWVGEIDINDGIFNWPENQLKLLGGEINFDVFIDSKQTIPYWQVNLFANQLNPSAINRDQQDLLKGPVSARVELSGNGSDLRQLMASINGRLSLGLDDVTLEGANLNALAPNFLKSTIRLINPFSGKEKEKRTVFECGVFHAMLEDGLMLADESILARTKEIDLTASWQLDLATEKQVIQAYPKQRATIAIPTGDLAKAVEISGTLAKPKIGVNKTDLVTGGAKTAFFFAGGWIYMMSMNEVQKNTEKQGACQKARDYWLEHSLTQMQQIEADQEAKKSASKSSSNNPRRGKHSRKP